MKDKYYLEAIKVMEELYGKDVQMSLATCINNQPSVRVVDFYFNEGCFFATPYSLSNKMKEIKINPFVALCKGLFQCWGKAFNEGNPLLDKNKEIREILKKEFHLFYDKHVNENDINTCILRIKLDKAVVFANNYKYIIDFNNKEAERFDFVNDILEI